MLEVLVDTGHQLGECVLWCERTGRVWWTDIPGATLYALTTSTGKVDSWLMPERLASFALTAHDDQLLLGLASRLALFNLSTGLIAELCPVEPGLSTRVNDGRCDRQGRFVFGTFNEAEPKERIGAYYRLEPDLALVRLPLPACAIANSICFSPDGATMYYANSPDRAIRCCDYDPASGTISNDRLFARVPGEQGEPDGSCIDAEGHLWNAQWGAAMLVRYAPDGAVERKLACPATQPSCVTFGGAALDTLYVTSARIGLAHAAQADGALLSGRLSVRGLPEVRFCLA